MAYTPPDADNVVLRFTGGYTPPASGTVVAEFDTRIGDIQTIGIASSTRFGAPAVLQQRFLKAEGTDVARYGTPTIERVALKIYPVSIAPPFALGTVQVKWRQFINGFAGLEPPLWPLAIRTRLAGGYNPPPAEAVILNWTTEPYTRPPAENIVLEFGALGYGYVLAVSLGDQTKFGTAVLKQPVQAKPDGIESIRWGTTWISNKNRTVYPFALDSLEPGTTKVINGALGITLPTIPSSAGYGEPFVSFRVRTVVAPTLGTGAAGAPAITHKQRFLPTEGFENPQVFGTAAVEHRIRYVYPVGTRFVQFGTARVWQAENQNVYAGSVAPTVTFGEPIVIDASLKLTGIGPGLVPAPKIENLVRYIYPAEFEIPGFPNYAPYVEMKTRVLKPSSWTSSSFSYIGTLIENKSPALKADGRVQTLWGNAHVANVDPDRLYVTPGGIAHAPDTGPPDQQQLPPPTIALRARIVTPAGIPSTNVWGSTYIAHYTQFIDLAGRGPSSGIVSAPDVSFGKRYIEPPFIASAIFGTANVAFILKVYPAGFDASVVPDNAELSINRQNIYPHTGEADPAKFGGTKIRNHHEFVKPAGWLSDTFNFPVIVNKARIVPVLSLVNTQTWPTYGPTIENRARVLAAFGFETSRFAVIGNVIENKARAITPVGIASLQIGRDTFIARNERFIYPEPWVEFYSSRYSAARNAAAQLLPASRASTVVFGTPSLLNLSRTVKHHTPSAGEVFGTAFIAPRVRYVAPGPFKDVPFGIPEIRLNPYTIKPVGWDSFTQGGYIVEERFTKVFPKSVNVHSQPWVGEPIVANRNKTLVVFPSDQSLYGLARVENKVKRLPVDGIEPGEFGRHVVEYRAKKLGAPGIGPPVFSVVHRIRNVIPDPPADQRIAPGGFGGERMGDVQASISTIYPGSIPATAAMGAPTVRDNTIRVLKGIFGLDQVGFPTVSTTQYVRAVGTPPTIQFGKPRMTPHHIYAPEGDQAAYQYFENNGYSSGAIDSGWRGDGYPYKGVGEPTVSLFNRTFYATGRADSVFGYPSMGYKLQFIKPLGTRFTRMGTVIIPFVPQTLDLDREHEGLPSDVAFGEHAVTPPPSSFRQVAAGGGDMSVFGTTSIELKNRAIRPEGIPHRGNPQQGFTNPWGDALVGYPRRYELEGEVLTLWGTAWVSNKIRTYQLDGFDSSIVAPDDDLDSFQLRTRVKRATPKNGIQSIVSTLAFGTATVGQAFWPLVPSGETMGAVGNPRVARRIGVSGIDSFAAGNVDRWEAGKIKSAGADSATIGTPRMGHYVHPSSAPSSAFGGARIARPLRPTGVAPPAMPVPAAIDELGCGVKVVAARSISPPTTPTPVIA